MSARIAFAEFILDTNDERLIGADGPVHVGNKGYRVLHLLVASAGQLVTKDRLFDEVWPGTIVSESALTSVIKELRRALGDDPRAPRFIESVYGRGYRFVASPSHESGEREEVPVSAAALPEPGDTGRLVGRQGEMGALVELLDTSRMVTIVGPGGVGKTSLATAFCRSSARRYDDGIWFVGLSDVASAEGVAEAIAAAMRLSLPIGPTAHDTLIDRLRSRRCLVILDNCEHVLDAVSRLAEDMVAQSRGVRLLLTSQEPTGIVAERVFRLTPLSAPGAAELFVARVRSKDDAFSIDDNTATAIDRICERLDNVPLAIEMAAARVPALGCAAILARLDDRFRVLVEGQRTSEPRHRTMLAALDWSHGLLSDRDKAVFRRLSVFAGSFSLDAATAVASDHDLIAFDVIDAVASLVAKSLLNAREEEGTTRYSLIETTHAFASIKLDDAGERATIARCHALHYAQVAKPMWSRFIGEVGDIELARHDAVEFPNLYRALDWAFAAGGDAELGLSIVADSASLWDDRLLDQRLRVAMPHISSATPAHIRARLLAAKAHVAMRLDLASAVDVVDDAVDAMLASVTDPVAICDALLNKGSALWLLGRYGEARRVADEAWALVEGAPESRIKAFAACLDAALLAVAGDRDAATARFDAAVASLRMLGAHGLANFWRSMALRLLPSPDRDHDIERWRVLLNRIRPGEMYAEGVTIVVANELGRRLADRGTPADLHEAVDLARLFFQTGALKHQHRFVLTMALVAAKAGRGEDAAALLGYATARLVATGDTRDHRAEQVRALLKPKLAPHMLEAWLETGAGFGANDVIARALGGA